MYQIVIRNLGGGVAQQVRVEDDLPAGVQLVNAEPLPQMQGGRAAWMLSSLLPGSEQTIRVTLKADANVQLANSTSVHVSAANITQRAALAPNVFGVRVIGPERLGLRKQTTFDVHVHNSTSQPLTKIVLHAELPAGLVMQMKDEHGKMREERLIDGPVNGMVHRARGTENPQDACDGRENRTLHGSRQGRHRTRRNRGHHRD